MSEHNPYAAPTADVSTEVAEQGVELAGRGNRLLASIIDGFLLLAVLAPLATISGWWDRAMADELTLLDNVAGFFAGMLGILLVNGYLLARRGQTVGKLLCRIRIVSSIDGSLLPLTRLITHRLLPVQLASVLPVVGQLLALIDAVFIFREDRRCVHDMVAGTIVVRADVVRARPAPAA